MYNLKIRRVGNSLGVTIPKAALEELNVGEGDVLCLSSAPDGFRVTPHDDVFAKGMKALEKGQRQYRNALRELTK